VSQDAAADPTADDLVERVRARLAGSVRVDASRIRARQEGEQVVLAGAVATPEEAVVALMLAELEADTVIDDLVVDPFLREGDVEAAAREQVLPTEDEVLVGDPDMLAVAERSVTVDVVSALEENEPLDPPDEPHLAPTWAEERGAVIPLVYPSDDLAALDEGEEAEAGEVGDEARAADDLTAADLRGPGRPPALDPERAALPEDLEGHD
jgi:hypothetical protein